MRGMPAPFECSALHAQSPVVAAASFTARPDACARNFMESIATLLAPKGIAVVGASQRRGRGTNVVANLKTSGFRGSIFAVNPRYD
jgi:hypothetical protein